MLHHPAKPFAISEPGDQEVGEFYVVRERLRSEVVKRSVWHTPVDTRPTLSQFSSFLPLEIGANFNAWFIYLIAAVINCESVNEVFIRVNLLFYTSCVKCSTSPRPTVLQSKSFEICRLTVPSYLKFPDQRISKLYYYCEIVNLAILLPDRPFHKTNKQFSIFSCVCFLLHRSSIKRLH